jgi:hypothetical protein
MWLFFSYSDSFSQRTMERVVCYSILNNTAMCKRLLKTLIFHNARSTRSRSYRICMSETFCIMLSFVKMCPQTSYNLWKIYPVCIINERYGANRSDRIFCESTESTFVDNIQSPESIRWIFSGSQQSVAVSVEPDCGTGGQQRILHKCINKWHHTTTVENYSWQRQCADIRRIFQRW